MFTKWLENRDDDIPTDLYGASADDVLTWPDQTFEPGERPMIMLRGTQYEVIGKPFVPAPKGTVCLRLPHTHHSGRDKLIPVRVLLSAIPIEDRKANFMAKQHPMANSLDNRDAED